MRSTEQKPPAIEKEITSGLMLWLGQSFGLKEGSSLFYSADSTKALRVQVQKLQQEGKTLSFPLMYLKLAGMSRDLERPGYNQRSLARHGIYVRTDDKDREYARKLHLMRVDMNFEVTFQVQQQDDALGFSALWMTLGQENRLNFTVNYLGIAVDIPCKLDTSISIPEKETSIDEALNIYEFTASIVVEGYVTALHVDNDTNVSLVRNVSTGINTIDSVAILASDSKTLNKALDYRNRP